MLSVAWLEVEERVIVHVNITYTLFEQDPYLGEAEVTVTNVVTGWAARWCMSRTETEPSPVRARGRS